MTVWLITGMIMCLPWKVLADECTKGNFFTNIVNDIVSAGTSTYNHYTKSATDLYNAVKSGNLDAAVHASIDFATKGGDPSLLFDTINAITPEQFRPVAMKITQAAADINKRMESIRGETYRSLYEAVKKDPERLKEFLKDPTNADYCFFAAIAEADWSDPKSAIWSLANRYYNLYQVFCAHDYKCAAKGIAMREAFKEIQKLQPELAALLLYEISSVAAQKEYGSFWDNVKVQPTHLNWLYDDKKSGARSDGSIWAPLLGQGCISLGVVGQNGYNNPGNGKVFCNVGPRGVWWDYPTDYAFIYRDRCSGGRNDISIWAPVCPKGFRAVGHAASGSHWTKPPLTQVACLRDSLSVINTVPASEAGLQWKWDDGGSGAIYDVTLYNYSFGGAPVMFAYPGYNPNLSGFKVAVPSTLIKSSVTQILPYKPPIPLKQ